MTDGVSREMTHSAYLCSKGCVELAHRPVPNQANTFANGRKCMSKLTYQSVPVKSQTKLVNDIIFIDFIPIKTIWN